MDSIEVKREIEILVNGVSMVFSKKGHEATTALKDIHLEVYKNEFVSLLGPSGCGKSTLLRLMADLIQPTSGEILIQNAASKEARTKRKYGIVFQSPTLFDWRTVRENIELPLEVQGRKKKERLEISENLLELVSLTAFKDHYPWQLSGGMQQRVAIARALSVDPSILFMDEPFSALDEFTKEKLQLELMEIQHKTSKTILFVTHSIPEAVFLSDRIIVLSAHPGQVHSILKVDLGEHRNLHVRESDKFYDTMTKVRKSIYEESGRIDEFAG
jgi:NitT/TauT family transport system ATP-binding protein